MIIPDCNLIPSSRASGIFNLDGLYAFHAIVERILQPVRACVPELVHAVFASGYNERHTRGEVPDSRNVCGVALGGLDARFGEEVLDTDRPVVSCGDDLWLMRI